MEKKHILTYVTVIENSHCIKIKKKTFCNPVEVIKMFEMEFYNYFKKICNNSTKLNYSKISKPIKN